jgi:heat shock protein HslJ
LHFNRLDGAAAAVADPEHMMTLTRLIAGWHLIVCAAFAAGLSLLASGSGHAADQFPFDQELVLDAAPMRPAKRVPILTVTPDGKASIDLWCKSVGGKVEFADTVIKIEADPLPDALPDMMSDGQCKPQRLQADQDLLAALAQVTSWHMQGSALVLAGPIPLKFRPSDH